MKRMLVLACGLLAAAVLRSDMSMLQNELPRGAHVSLHEIWGDNLLWNCEPYYYNLDRLPLWQQRQLFDPGWNQPYIPPRAGTPIPAPTYEQLMEETAKAREKK
jgi:hypothetical protein